MTRELNLLGVTVPVCKTCGAAFLLEWARGNTDGS